MADAHVLQLGLEMGFVHGIFPRNTVAVASVYILVLRNEHTFTFLCNASFPRMSYIRVLEVRVLLFNYCVFTKSVILIIIFSRRAEVLFR